MASLQGKIIEFYTGRGVSGALVSLAGRTAVTDANGIFTLVNIPVGYHDLQVLHRDFHTHVQSLGVTQERAFSLPAPIRIMSVVRPL